MNDEDLRSSTNIRIFNFGGLDSSARMIDALFSETIPDVLAFSVMGWDYQRFARVSEVFRALKPQGWIIYGGNHVANQGARIFAECPQVDVLVNGEGELSFPELLRAHLGGRRVEALNTIGGISFRSERGLPILAQSSSGVVTTPTERIQSLDLIPSPLLTGTINLRDVEVRKKYAGRVMLETNRGCPFRCAFCYWGGAIGQKVRAFSRERLRAELELLGECEVEVLNLCDANFGMIPQDEQFVEDLLEVKEKYGFPKALVTPWGKNKSDLFFRIVEALKAGGLFSNFIVSLQSTSSNALVSMRRQNMKINEWEPLVDWCLDQDLSISSELIWGAPGETVESFLKGFDDVAAKVERIACYNLMLMPNTEYWDQREALGIVAKRSEVDDYYTVLFTKSFSLDDNRRMHSFLFWQMALHNFGTLRNIWRSLQQLSVISVSQALLSVDDWFCALPREGAVGALMEARDRTVCELEISPVRSGIQALYQGWSALAPQLEAWFEREILPRCPREVNDALGEIFRFDLATAPVYDARATRGLEPITLAEEPMYLRSEQTFLFNVPKIAQERVIDRLPAPELLTRSIIFPAGFAEQLNDRFRDALGPAYAGTAVDPHSLQRALDANMA